MCVEEMVTGHYLGMSATASLDKRMKSHTILQWARQNMSDGSALATRFLGQQSSDFCCIESGACV